MPAKRPVSVAALQREGFVGWVSFTELPAALSSLAREAGGVYIVWRPSLEPPRFVEASPAGRFRGDPSVSEGVLWSNWVEPTHVLYIGKGNHGRLRARMSEFAGFGGGGGARHWGGRLIWQLADATELLIAWLVVVPRKVRPV